MKMWNSKFLVGMEDSTAILKTVWQFVIKLNTYLQHKKNPQAYIFMLVNENVSLSKNL